jgi:hypothetical protein
VSSGSFVSLPDRSGNQNRNFFSWIREQDEKTETLRERQWREGGRTDAGIRVDDELVAADLLAVLPHRSRGEQQERRRVTSGAIRIWILLGCLAVEEEVEVEGDCAYAFVWLYRARTADKTEKMWWLSVLTW